MLNSLNGKRWQDYICDPQWENPTNPTNFCYTFSMKIPFAKSESNRVLCLGYVLLKSCKRALLRKIGSFRILCITI